MSKKGTASRPDAKHSGSKPKAKTPRIEEEFVREGAQKITDKDVENVVNKADEIGKKFSKGGPLGRFIEDGQLLISLVKDYWTRRYRGIPYFSIAAIAFTLLYVFNPLDLVPDVIPIVGQIDDAVVVGICLRLIEQDLHNYGEWKMKGATNDEQ